MVHQVHRSICNVDRSVVGGDFTGVGAVRFPHHVPAFRSSTGHIFVVLQKVGATTNRHTVGLAVNSVVDLTLHAFSDVISEVRDEVDVERLNVSTHNQTQSGITRGRHNVVLASAHQGDHLVRGSGHTGVDNTSRLSGEFIGPGRLHEARPVHDVELTFEIAHFFQHWNVGHIEGQLATIGRTGAEHHGRHGK